MRGAMLCLLAFSQVIAAPCMASALLSAQLSRQQLQFGETFTLDIEMDGSSRAPDTTPLQKDFVPRRTESGREVRHENGEWKIRQRFRIELQPRRSGMLEVPSLQVGNARTPRFMVEVLSDAGAAEDQDTKNGDVHVSMQVDTLQPYVQQAVGVTVQLHYAEPARIVEGQLDLPSLPDVFVQPFGEDTRQRQVRDGRVWQVISRHYLLVPDARGQLHLPGAIFHGDVIVDGAWQRQILTRKTPGQVLNVLPIPAGQGRDWLPAYQLALAFDAPPAKVHAGEAIELQLTLRADGAIAAQLPDLQLRTEGAQVFALPAQNQEGMHNGRPFAVQVRRFSVLPEREGRLVIGSEPIRWWDVEAKTARQAQVAPLLLDVLPALPGSRPQASAASAQVQATDGQGVAMSPDTSMPSGDNSRFSWRGIAALPLFLFLLALGLAGAAWQWHRRHRQCKNIKTVRPRWRTLKRALDKGDVAQFSRLFPALAPCPAQTLSQAAEQLRNVGQQQALQELEAALWGAGDMPMAMENLRQAFSVPPQWHVRHDQEKALLPPLYP